MQAGEQDPGYPDVRRRRRDRVELPSLSTIKDWKDEGLSYQAMVDRWYEQTEGKELATRAAFALVCSRKGWTDQTVKAQPVIPWVVETRHQNKYKLQMLRAIGQQARGEKLAKRLESKVGSFLAKRAGKTVIHYEPNSAEGFWDIPVEWFDLWGDKSPVVRDPELHSLTESKAPPVVRRQAVIDAARAKFRRPV